MKLLYWISASVKRHCLKRRVEGEYCSSGSHFVQQSNLSNYGRGHYGAHLYETILSLGQQFRTRLFLNILA